MICKYKNYVLNASFLLAIECGITKCCSMLTAIGTEKSFIWNVDIVHMSKQPSNSVVRIFSKHLRIPGFSYLLSQNVQRIFAEVSVWICCVYPYSNVLNILVRDACVFPYFGLKDSPVSDTGEKPIHVGIEERVSKTHSVHFCPN